MHYANVRMRLSVAGDAPGEGDIVRDADEVRRF